MSKIAKRIKDPVHGYIPVEENIIDIIDHRHFQRLRKIRQLTATYMVYPSANHTRFEHSIGVYYLAKKAFESLCESDEFENVDELVEIRNSILSAALLHDIGHPPLSHLCEELLDREELKDRLILLPQFNSASSRSCNA